MASLFRLRKIEPDLPRPYVTPLYPHLPAVALFLSTVCFGAMLFANPGIGFTFIAIMTGSKGNASLRQYTAAIDN